MLETKLGTIELADRVSARAFLLSLMREWRGWSIESEATLPSDSALPRRVLRLPLVGRDIRVALTHASQVGSHGIRPP